MLPDDPQGLGASADADQALVASDQAASRLAPSGFDPSRLPFTPITELCDMLREQVRVLSERAYGTKPRWARYTLAGELVETLAQRIAVAPKDDLAERLRSPDYHISAETLHEAADRIDAIAMETRRAETAQTGSVAKP
jgi:hypothetical protein